MRLDHFAIYCSDLPLVKEFFVKYFSAMPDAEHLSLRTGQTNCFLSFPEDGARLELMTYPTPSKRVSENKTVSHISLGVGSTEEVDKLTEKLLIDGFKVLSGPRITGDGYYESCIETIEGIIIELTI